MSDYRVAHLPTSWGVVLSRTFLFAVYCVVLAFTASFFAMVFPIERDGRMCWKADLNPLSNDLNCAVVERVKR